MDENEKLNYSVEPEQEAPEETAPQTPVPPVSANGEPKPQKMDQKSRAKIFALLCGVAVVASVGGVGLKAAIRAISQRNAAYQQSLSGQTEQEAERPEQEPEQAPQKPYTLETSGLPDTLPSHSGDQSLTPAQVYALNAPAVVCIESKQTQSFYGQEYSAVGVGSGFILTQDGYILTNCHMVEGSELVTVTLYDGTEYEAEVVGADAMGDVALLKIEAENLTAVSIAEEDTLCVGDEVVAIGNPFGELEYSMSHGYVSGLDREITIENTPIRMIQTDTPINSGNSGGPLLDMNGNVVGIASAKYSGMSASGVMIENIGFAIPIHDALAIAYDLEQYGYVRGRAYLGVTVLDLDADLARDYGLPVGPRVETVSAGSCAEKAGIRAGDFILAIEDETTETTNDLLAVLLHHKAGESVGVAIYRAGAQLHLSVTLDERPQTAASSAPHENAGEEPETEFDLPEAGIEYGN